MIYLCDRGLQYIPFLYTAWQTQNMYAKTLAYTAAHRGYAAIKAVSERSVLLPCAENTRRVQI